MDLWVNDKRKYFNKTKIIYVTIKGVIKIRSYFVKVRKLGKNT